MRTAILVGLAFLIVGCRNETDVVKQTISEARRKPKLDVMIRAEDLALRKSLEKAIEQDRIGTVLDANSGNGYMKLRVEVDDTVTTIPKIRALLSRQGLLERSTIVVIP